MLGIRYLKAEPTTFVMRYARGEVAKKGAGLSFFYYAPSTSVVLVPLESQDVPFAFQELSADYQQLTVQGALTFRVVDPERLASILNFSVNRFQRYQTNDPEKVRARLINVVQERTRTVLRRLAMREAVMAGDQIGAEVMAAMREVPMLREHGLGVIGLTIAHVSATPEMTRALEAEAREELQRKADEAVYARRNAAVEQERRIKDSEMATEIMVEEKKRQIRETQIAADIAVEEQRARLLEMQSRNDREAADTRAYALEAALKPLRATDWRTLVAANGADPQTMIALAFRDMADNAGRIGELNITSELLTSLLRKPKG
ncbi:MAG: SPFH domain-containing protein [Candidatus Sumerlaeia bacterium]|nr:SPFH domain-containing protein [Candidatus Sumerlaeia bacterium]